MSLFSSSSKKNYETNNYTRQQDERISTAGYGDGLTIGGRDNSTVITDGGAINGALSLSESLGLAAFELSKESTGQMGDAMGKTYGYAADFADQVLEAGYYSQDKASEVLAVADNMATQAFSQVEKMSQSETANEIQTLGRYGAMLLGLTVLGFVVVKLKG